VTVAFLMIPLAATPVVVAEKDVLLLLLLPPPPPHAAMTMLDIMMLSNFIAFIAVSLLRVLTSRFFLYGHCVPVAMC
jgi:hypothetical protein